MKLNDTHLVLLSAAAQDQSRLLPRPEHLSDKSAQSLATKLMRAGLVDAVTVRSSQPHWKVDDKARPVGLRMTAQGLAAIGLEEVDERCAPRLEREAEPQFEREPRAGTKKAAVLELLRREEGATLDELIAATGWLPHTTRAALTGLRQRGYTLDKIKSEDSRTVYRIRSEAAAVLAGEEA